MKKLITLSDTHMGLDPRNVFSTAWVAAFLGVVLIIGAIFWAIAAARAMHP
jgi:hypothetical protein